MGIVCNTDLIITSRPPIEKYLELQLFIRWQTRSLIYANWIFLLLWVNQDKGCAALQHPKKKPFEFFISETEVFGLKVIADFS